MPALAVNRQGLNRQPQAEQLVPMRHGLGQGLVLGSTEDQQRTGGLTRRPTLADVAQC